MSGAWRPLRRAVVWVGVLAMVDVGGARLLDGVGVADRLLSGGIGAIGWLPVMVVFFAARLMLYWVMPGLLMRAVLVGLVEKGGAAR